MPVVLTWKMGKQRPFGVVLLLYVVTFGIYGIYWHYKAHHEVFNQFELAREARDEGVVWLILGLALFSPLLWVYQHGFVKNINYVRARMRMRPRISPGGFLGMTIPGNIIMFVGLIMLFIGLGMLATEARPDDPTTFERDESITAAEAERENDAGAVVAVIGGPLFLAGAALQIAAFALLQGAINDIWKAFDFRMQQFRPSSGGPPPGRVAAPPPAPTMQPGWRRP